VDRCEQGFPQVHVHAGSVVKQRLPQTGFQSGPKPKADAGALTSNGRSTQWQCNSTQCNQTARDLFRFGITFNVTATKAHATAFNVRCNLQYNSGGQTADRKPDKPSMNYLFFTTVFNVFTTDLHFFNTPPSILTTPPFILNTLLCSLRSEICGYLGLGRHAAHKIKKSGDVLTVSAPNICPSTTTVDTPYVRVICTGAAPVSQPP
jgi:hypothetical protein